MTQINRDDMLELTRRMTLARNCFSRIAGAYFDRDGFVDGTFNTNFRKLPQAEQSQKLKIAKAIPFSETNAALKEYRFPAESKRQGSVWQFLKGVLGSDLKNDALMDVFYEMFGEKYRAGQEYGVYFFLGNYDIPRKGTDQAFQWESEEVYRFLICAVCPVDENYEPKEPECGFLFPAYKNRGGAVEFVDVFRGDRHPELLDILFQ